MWRAVDEETVMQWRRWSLNWRNWLPLAQHVLSTFEYNQLLDPMKLRPLYLAAAVLGTALPYYHLVPFLLDEGLDLSLFVEQLFANAVSSTFAVDLLISSFVFWIFMEYEGRRLAISHRWLYVVCSLTVGLSLALPLFLYVREGK